MATDVVVTLKGKCPRTNTLSTFHVFTSSSHLLTWEYKRELLFAKNYTLQYMYNKYRIHVLADNTNRSLAYVTMTTVELQYSKIRGKQK